MYYNKEDFSMYYEKYGDGNKTIVILPGWGETRATFYHIINYFSEKYTIYIMDFPGFGKSIFPDRDLSIYDYANLIRDFMEDEKITNPILLAHSFGGRIATLITGYYKDKVEKLILIDSAGIKPRKGILKLLKQTIYKLLKKCSVLVPRKKRSLYLKRLIYIFGSSDLKKLNKNMYNSFIKVVNEDLKCYYSYISTKTLLIWGRKDKSTPVRDGKYMKKHIKDSTLFIYPKAGHFSYLEYIEVTNQIIEEFLES